MPTARPYLATTPVALAHRGGARYAPNVGLENTLTAFGHAVALGYTHLETDVHLTRDGRLVAFHDGRLDRVTDRSGRIRDLPWSEVAAAGLSGEHAEAAHEHVPLLTDVLDA
ncbi:MAG: glycerophosphodiester phosphodiesterase family protein, partial [Terracoccus sp.]